jgi:hypothetical protein
MDTELDSDDLVCLVPALGSRLSKIPEASILVLILSVSESELVSADRINS